MKKKGRRRADDTGDLAVLDGSALGRLKRQQASERESKSRNAGRETAASGGVKKAVKLQ